MKEHVIFFCKKIIALENALCKFYNLNATPYSVAGKDFPKKGEFIFENEEVQYLFHGGGATFQINDKIFDYDILSSRRNAIRINPWKFNRFLKTATNIRLSEVDLIVNLNQLEKEGILTRLDEGDNMFEINIDSLMR